MEEKIPFLSRVRQEPVRRGFGHPKTGGTLTCHEKVPAESNHHNRIFGIARGFREEDPYTLCQPEMM